MLEIYSKAPDIDIETHDGYTGPLSHYWQNGPLILFFYPKDDTSVCTKQACSMQESLAQFGEFKANVLGVNNGSLDSHRAFAEKNGLEFPLVVDHKGAMAKAFDAWRSLIRIPKRVTYVIGRQGSILGAHHNELRVKPHLEMIEKNLG